MDASQPSALTKRNPDSTLMLPPPPPPPSKRQKRPATVLDEDTYSEALSHIIARDYFPGLLETQVQEEFIEASKSKDKQWIAEAGKKLAQVMTPGPSERRRTRRGTSFTPQKSGIPLATPRHYIGDTPVRTPTTVDDNDSTPDMRSKVDLSLSLGAFQEKYTSEDNESFNALLDKQNGRHAAKYAFLHHGNKIPSTRQIAYQTDGQKTSKDGCASLTLTTKNAAGEERRELSASRPSQDLDIRQASVDNFPSRQGPRNSLMFEPDGVEDRTATYIGVASNVPMKGVRYSATRFQIESESDNTIPPSPSISAIEAAIAGQPRTSTSKSGYWGSETPRVKGYAFVDEDPTPSECGIPITEEEADAAEQEAMEILLPKLDGSGPGLFSIAESSKRENLHHKLVEKADAGRRKGGRTEQLKGRGITPKQRHTPGHPSSLSDKTGASMTPAARRLAQTIRTPRNESSLFGSELKSDVGHKAWTPTPRLKKAA